MNKKGFTLIELLAVIVILAIIALIATPIVLNIISETKASASLRSGEFYLDAIEQTILKEMLDGTQVENGTYAVMDDGKLCMEMNFDSTCVNGVDIEINGQAPDTGLVKIEDGKVTYSKLAFDGNILVSREGTLTRYDESLNDGTPKLVLKTENGVIDNANNFVYSFYTTEPTNFDDYDQMILSDYFDVENGQIEYKKNSYETYSTGAEIILKDSNGKIVDTYTVIIFGDINGDAMIDGLDVFELEFYLIGNKHFNRINIKAADINIDGKITSDDNEIINSHDAWICRYDQIRRICDENY